MVATLSLAIVGGCSKSKTSPSRGSSASTGITTSVTSASDSGTLPGGDEGTLPGGD